ncbi:MAG: hypothetical protein RLZZ385_1073 [Pseudomonadota bacterium]|jgi:ssDNA-binding Zn-finger/Zn-ribbon topoisomerase 1
MTAPDDKDISRVHFCPACKKPLRHIVGKMGPFWGCTGFPRCRTMLYDRDGKPSTEADEHYRCPVCTRPMVRTSNKRGDYWYCTGFRKGCKVRLQDDHGRPETAYRCRHCGQLLVRRKGRNGVFWGCSRYPECTATYNDLNGVPDLDILVP